MSICHIVGAGECNLRPASEAGDIVIAADGGYDALAAWGIEPDVVIGDLDSISSAPRGEILRYPVRKDETDMALAYREGVRRGFRRFRIYGGTGGRADHSFANYALLLYAKEHGGEAELCDRTSTTRVIKNESVTLCGKAGRHFSVFSFGGTAHGVTIRGASYEARGIDIEGSSALGVSNEFTDEPTTIEVLDGALIIMVEEEL